MVGIRQEPLNNKQLTIVIIHGLILPYQLYNVQKKNIYFDKQKLFNENIENGLKHRVE